MGLTSEQMRQLARRAATELGFQASELDAMDAQDLAWWLSDDQ